MKKATAVHAKLQEVENCIRSCASDADKVASLPRWLCEDLGVQYLEHAINPTSIADGQLKNFRKIYRNTGDHFILNDEMIIYLLRDLGVLRRRL